MLSECRFDSEKEAWVDEIDNVIEGNAGPR